MDITRDDSQTIEARPFKELAKRVEAGEAPQTVARDLGLDLNRAIAERKVPAAVLRALGKYYLNKQEAKAVTQARLLELGFEAEDEKTQVAALKEVRHMLEDGEGGKKGMTFNFNPQFLTQVDGYKGREEEEDK